MDGDLTERVRELRARGATPKQIARTLGVPAPQVTALIRTMAAEQAETTRGRLVGCWVSPRWSADLIVAGHPEWPGVDPGEDGGSGLAAVLVVHEERRHRVEVCGYLVDTFCLGVKGVLSPRVIAADALDAFVRHYYRSFDGPPLRAPLDLAQHLVFGATAYALELGFHPTPAFGSVSDRLGKWTPPSPITFGHKGKPLYIQGPHDDPSAIIATLSRTKGRGNFDIVIGVPR